MYFQKNKEENEFYHDRNFLLTFLCTDGNKHVCKYVKSSTATKSKSYVEDI